MNTFKKYVETKEPVPYPFLPKEQLEKLSTERLLAYKRSKSHLLYAGNACSCGSQGCGHDTLFSRNPELEAQVLQLKKDLAEVLATREHIPRI